MTDNENFESWESVKVTVCNLRGLHARAAVRLSKLLENYTADVRLVANGGDPVCARSVMEAMMLAASKGTMLNVIGHGDDAPQALEAVADLFKNRFDEAE
ncbi:MAG: HPr family phosphocarrier protein [Alphaproteobacteria bacterium]